MRIGRTLPPAAASLGPQDLWHGVTGLVARERGIRTLEDEIRREFGVTHVFLVSSGTAALTLTLSALQSLSPRREVVLPAFTCFSVPAAILKAGLRPVPCDINASTFDFDAALFNEALTDQTLCVIAHHLFGVPSDVERLRRTCHPRRIVVIEDAAQAMGAEARGRKLGTVGDVGIFSLGRGKNITCGSGGVIVTSSDQIARAIDRRYRHLAQPPAARELKELARIALMALFIRPSLYWIPAALPFLRLGETIFPKDIPMMRLGGMNAGLLRGWRSRLARSNRLRAETARWFGRHLPVRLATEDQHPYLRLPVVVPNPVERARIRSTSRRHGLGISAAFPTPVTEIPEVRAVCHGGRFPSAGRVAETLLTVPTHHWLSDRDKHAIVNLFRGTDPAQQVVEKAWQP
jgi:perosamine synthetase